LDFSKVVLIVPVMLAVTTRARLRRLIFVHSASVVAIAVVSSVNSRLALGRLEGALAGFIPILTTRRGEKQMRQLNESPVSGRIAANEEGRITWSDYRKGRSLSGAQ